MIKNIKNKYHEKRGWKFRLRLLRDLFFTSFKGLEGAIISSPFRAGFSSVNSAGANFKRIRYNTCVVTRVLFSCDESDRHVRSSSHAKQFQQ